MKTNTNTNDYQNESKSSTSTSNVILSSSLIWFGYGMGLVFLLAFGLVKLPFMEKISIQISQNPIIWIVFSIAIFILIFFVFRKMFTLPIGILILAYSLYCVFMAGIISLVFLTYAGNVTNLLLVLTIPGVTMGVMGTLGYFEIFNFGKLRWFLGFALIGLIILGLVTYFTQSKKLYTVYCILGYIVFMLYTGFDLWRIKKTERFLENTNQIHDKKLIRRYGIIFGLNLLIDYLQLVLFISRFIKS